jgi:ATP-dependent RNA helicase RhlE
MLDMGHMPDIKNLFQNLPSAKMPLKGEKTHMQVMMYTATLMPKIMNLISRFAPQNEKIDLNWDMKPPTEIHSVVYHVTSRRKHSLLAYLLRRKGSLKDKKVLVFARTGQRVINLAESLMKDGIKAHYIHRRLSLSARRTAVDGFRDNNFQVLISTDLMARGMDIADIYCVVNYDVPFIPEEYLHRIGRVGRAGRSGLAITFVSKTLETVEFANRVVQLDENEYIKKIEELLGRRILVSKIPGPFQDVAKFPERELLRERTGRSLLDEKAEETKQKYLDKNHRIVDNAKKIKNWKNRTPREKEASRITHKKTHSLRDFEEGRYENVVLSLEAKKNRKEGIVVPTNYTDILKKMDEKLKLKREMKKERMQAKYARE